MLVRKANENDIKSVAEIYSEVITAAENGKLTVGWKRGIYPTEKTAKMALKRDDLFVAEDNGSIIGTAIINQIQVDTYKDAAWQYPAKDSEVMVLHTLAISPRASGNGCGKNFVAFYENLAKQNGCKYLRMDTNQKNRIARAMYSKLGYKEIGVIPCVFNGIEGVNLVLLEKRLKG